MQGLKNLFSDSHGFIAGLLIIGATVLAALGVMPLDKWINYTQVIFVAFAGSHAVISAADSIAVSKLGRPTEAPKSVVDVVKDAADKAAKTAIVLLVALATAACSANPKVLAGEQAAATCVIETIIQHAGDVEKALGQPDYASALKDVAKKDSLSNDALTCLVQTIIAVLSAPDATGSGSASATTQQPSPVIINGKAWLASQHK